MSTYQTQGIITSVEITKLTVSFKLLPASPYSFEEKVGDEKVKYILWVSEAEPADASKVALKLDKSGISLSKDKMGKNETLKVQGATLEKDSVLSLNLQGVPTSARKRDAKLIPVDTQCSFELGSPKVGDLGAFLILMQNRTKISVECTEAGFKSSPVSVSSISIAN